MREGKKREGTTMMRWRMRRDIVGEMVVYGGWCGRERERDTGGEGFVTVTMVLCLLNVTVWVRV